MNKPQRLAIVALTNYYQPKDHLHRIGLMLSFLRTVIFRFIRLEFSHFGYHEFPDENLKNLSTKGIISFGYGSYQRSIGQRLKHSLLDIIDKIK